MKVNMEQITPLQKKMSIAIPPEVVDREIDKAYLNIKKTVKLRGFRPGKAPVSLLQRYFKAQVEEDVISSLVKDSYPKALEEVKASPVSPPTIEKGILEKGKEFSYTVSFEIKPEIDVDGYIGLELELEEAVLTDEEIEDQLKVFQSKHATLKEREDPEHTVQNGDIAVIDYEALMNGKKFSGNSKKNAFIEIENDSFLPGFTTHLLGLKKGDNKTFTIEIPQDYEKPSLAGKKLEFTITVTEIKEKILPVIDDEFARDIGDFKDLEDLKSKISESLRAEKNYKIQEALKEKIFTALIEKNPFDVPSSMVENQIQNMIQNARQKLSLQGIGKEEMDSRVASLYEQYRDTAERQVRSALLLEAIAKKEGITVKDEDLEKKHEEIAGKIKQDVATIKKTFDRDILKSQILEEKTLDFIIAKANCKQTTD